jgi:hypothetical protein
VPIGGISVEPGIGEVEGELGESDDPGYGNVNPVEPPPKLLPKLERFGAHGSAPSPSPPPRVLFCAKAISEVIASAAIISPRLVLIVRSPAYKASSIVALSCLSFKDKRVLGRKACDTFTLKSGSAKADNQA